MERYAPRFVSVAAMEINSQTYRDLLQIEFQSRKSRNRYYSLRAFAQSLNIGSGALSEILSGKRNLSLAKANLLLDKLNFSEPEQEAFINSICLKTSSKNGSDKAKTVERNLTMDTFEIISSPLCLTIMAMSELDGFNLSMEWISSRVDATFEEIAKSLNLMKDVGIIEIINGEERISDDFVFSPDGISSRAIKNFHHQMLDQASHSLEEIPVELRDISGISFAIEKDQLPDLKKDILNFQKRMIKKYAAGKKDHIYQLEMALFPLTVVEKNNVLH